MEKVHCTASTQDRNLNAETGLDNQKKEEIITSLVEQGLPRVFNPNNFINRIAQNNGISVSDARECLKEAVEFLETKNKSNVQKPVMTEETPNGKSGYFYPEKTTIAYDTKKDGMDSLSAFGTFQKLRFGL